MVVGSFSGGPRDAATVPGHATGQHERQLLRRARAWRRALWRGSLPSRHVGRRRPTLPRRPFATATTSGLFCARHIGWRTLFQVCSMSRDRSLRVGRGPHDPHVGSHGARVDECANRPASQPTARTCNSCAPAGVAGKGSAHAGLIHPAAAIFWFTFCKLPKENQIFLSSTSRE